MLNCLFKNPYPLILKKNLRDYCLNSTNKSIKNLIDRNNSKKDKYKLNNNDNNNPINLIDIIFVFSISTIAFLLYKRIK
jgi:hypothetical protein